MIGMLVAASDPEADESRKSAQEKCCRTRFSSEQELMSDTVSRNG